MKRDYYSESGKLILHEYGRNIQNMVEHCLTIEDKDERQQCAESVIETMNMVSGRDKEREDYWQVLWDHLYIMSDFKLNVDFPCEVTTREEYESRVRCALVNEEPQKPTYRHYGKIIECMIADVVALPDGEERTALAIETAQQMKRSYVKWNKETVTNAKIFADLYELSKGRIYLDETTCDLHDAKEIQQPSDQVYSKTLQLKKNNQRNKNRRKK